MHDYKRWKLILYKQFRIDLGIQSTDAAGTTHHHERVLIFAIDMLHTKNTHNLPSHSTSQFAANNYHVINLIF